MFDIRPSQANSARDRSVSHRMISPSLPRMNSRFTGLLLWSSKPEPEPGSGGLQAREIAERGAGAPGAGFREVPARVGVRRNLVGAQGVGAGEEHRVVARPQAPVADAEDRGVLATTREPGYLLADGTLADTRGDDIDRVARAHRGHSGGTELAEQPPGDPPELLDFEPPRAGFDRDLRPAQGQGGERGEDRVSAEGLGDRGERLRDRIGAIRPF